MFRRTMDNFEVWLIRIHGQESPKPCPRNMNNNNTNNKSNRTYLIMVVAVPNHNNNITVVFKYFLRTTFTNHYNNTFYPV